MSAALTLRTRGVSSVLYLNTWVVVQDTVSATR